MSYAITHQRPNGSTAGQLVISKTRLAFVFAVLILKIVVDYNLEN